MSSIDKILEKLMYNFLNEKFSANHTLTNITENTKQAWMMQGYTGYEIFLDLTKSLWTITFL